MHERREMRQNFGISVVIPAHGRGEQLRHAIDSVRSRNPERVEILVIDDASPTMLGTLLPERNDAGIEVRSYRLQRNRGPAAARNLGIRRARFPYVALLDSDDRFTANKIDRVVEYLAAGDTDLLFHACRGMERYHHLAMFWWKRMRLMLPFPWLLAALATAAEVGGAVEAEAAAAFDRAFSDLLDDLRRALLRLARIAT